VLALPLLTVNCLLLSSLFNLSDLTAYFAPVIGCFIFMNDKPEIRADTGIDGGPSQISIMAFGILLLYLNIVSRS